MPMPEPALTSDVPAWPAVWTDRWGVYEPVLTSPDEPPLEV